MVPMGGVPNTTVSNSNDQLQLLHSLQLLTMQSSYSQPQLAQFYQTLHQQVQQQQQQAQPTINQTVQNLMLHVQNGTNPGLPPQDELLRLLNSSYPTTSSQPAITTMPQQDVNQYVENLKQQMLSVTAGTNAQTSTSTTSSIVPPIATVKTEPELTIDTSQQSSSGMCISKTSPAFSEKLPSPSTVVSATEEIINETASLIAQKSIVSDELELTEKNIKKNETTFEGLTKRKERLRTMANESDDPDEDITDEPGDEMQTIPLTQQIIEENKKRKNDFENSFPLHLRIPDYVAPLYLEPCDAPGMKELAMRHAKFAPRLRSMVMARKAREVKNHEMFEAEYKKKYDEWMKKDQEQQQKSERMAKESRWRQVFETTFKELSKQRGEKERQLRIDNRIGVEYLSVQADEVDAEKKKRNAACLPPLMISEVARRDGVHFVNENHIQKDVASKERKRINDFESTWSEQDLAMFKNRLKVVGKNFANIAAFFPDKSVKDCVQCYYLLIKKYNKEYKSMLPKWKRAVKKRYCAPKMPTVQELAKYHQNGDVENANGAPLVPDIRCSKCQQKLDPTQNSVRVTRAFADSYGKERGEKKVDLQICSKCYEAEQKLRSGRCLVKACFESNKKIKPTKPLPARWKQLDDRQRAFAYNDLGIPPDVTKTCATCNKKILKRLEQIFAGELEQQISEFESNAAWEDDEIALLLDVVERLGTEDWEGVAEQMDGRDAEECRLQWASSRPKTKLESEEEDEEAEENDNKDNGQDDGTLEEETQDIPDDDIKDERASAPVIDLSPEPMDTAPGPSVITSTDSMTAVASESHKIGSITAGTPLRPSSVTILETPSQPGPSGLNALPPSGTAPPQASSARDTPSIVSKLYSHILHNYTDQKEQESIFSALKQGMSQNGAVTALNPNNPFAGVDLRNPNGMALLQQYKALQEQQQNNQNALLRQQQQASQIAPDARIQMIHNQLLLQNMNSIISDPLVAQHLANQLYLHQQQQLQAQQMMQKPQPPITSLQDLLTRYEKAITEFTSQFDAAVQKEKRERINLFQMVTEANSHSVAEQAAQITIATLQRQFANSDVQSRCITLSQQLETYMKQLEEEKVTIVKSQNNLSVQLNATTKDIETHTTMIGHLGALLQQQQAMLSASFHNTVGQQQFAQAVFSLINQHSICTNNKNALIEKQTREKEELNAVTTKLAKIMEQLAACKQMHEKGKIIPTNLTELSNTVSKIIVAEHKQHLAEMRMRQQRPNPNILNLPSTTASQLQQQQFAQIYQQQAQAALQQQMQQMQQLQQLQQASVVTAVQKQQAQAQNAGVSIQRKDNTWVAELEKQGKIHQQQNKGMLNMIGKKVIGEELAAQAVAVSPGAIQQITQQAQVQGQQQGQGTPGQEKSSDGQTMKRKSGLESVVKIEKASNVRANQVLAGGATIGRHSPMTQAPAVVTPPKQPTSRSITGTTPGAPLAIQTATTAADNQQLNAFQSPNEFVSALRLPTREQQSMVSNPLIAKDGGPEVVRKQGMAYAPGQAPEGMKSGEPTSYLNAQNSFPFISIFEGMDGSATSKLGANQANLVSPDLKASPSSMTRDSVPTANVADIATPKPGTSNGLLGEIEPMSPDTPKNAASPATLGGEAQRSISAEPLKVYSSMDDCYFGCEDGPLYRPVSPMSQLYKEPYVDSPFEDFSDDEDATMADS